MSDGLDEPIGEEVTQCDACKFEGIPVKAYTDTGVDNKPQTLMLCEVCASTLIGTAARYPALYPDLKFYRTIGWIANKILTEMRVLRDEPGKHAPKEGQD